MKKDYLWDASGEPDPEIQGLEQILGGLRYDRPAPDFSRIPSPERRPRGRLLAWVAATWRPAILVPALAGLVVCMAASWWILKNRAACDVISLNGIPRIGSSHIAENGRLFAGQWLETDASSRAKINIGQIGQVEVEPNTRIGLIRLGSNENRLSLQRGVMHALIWAPPGQFFVNIPSAVAADLGCAYTLEVDALGAGLLRVTTGWVAFMRDGREAFVPAGALCPTRPGIGPGTPYRSDVSPAFSTALAQLDFQTGDSANRSAALATALAEAREKDAFSLWHLLSTVGEAERPALFERLSALAPPPEGVTRAGILRHDRREMDLWWNALGLGDTSWWRIWERSWPADK